jgi:hypothetical protein
MFQFEEFPGEYGMMVPHLSSEPSMLDVHPPHETVHTWRDFFIHVAPIKEIGLKSISPLSA